MKHFNFNPICPVCSKQFKTCSSNKKLCSKVCKREFYKTVYGNFGSPLTSATIGSIAELAVSVDLLKKGFAVFKALSPSCYCDVIAVKKDMELKLEVRTGYRLLNGDLTFPMKLSKYDLGNISGFAVMEKHTGNISYFNLNKEVLTF